MMNENTFNEMFRGLCLSFNASNVENRSAVYFHYLSFMSEDEFSVLVNHCVKNDSRMPSISDLLALHKRLFKPVGTKLICNECNGSGLVQIGLEMYRANCSHGNQQRQAVRPIPPNLDTLWQNQENDFVAVYGESRGVTMVANARQTHEDALGRKKKVGVDRWLDYMTKDPHKAFKGLVQVLPIMQGKYHLYDELKRNFEEFYGADYIAKHAKNYAIGRKIDTKDLTEVQ